MFLQMSNQKTTNKYTKRQMLKRCVYLQIIAGTLVSHYADLRAVNGVDVVGEIPSG